MAASKADIAVTGEWTDMVAEEGDLASVPAYVQNKDKAAVLVFFGGGSAPDGRDGILLKTGEMTFGTADHIWARAWTDGEAALVGCGTADAA